MGEVTVINLFSLCNINTFNVNRSGCMLWLDHLLYRNYTGNWQDGQMEGFGEMRYTRDHIKLYC